MILLYVIVVFAKFFNCVSLEHVWHSYQYDPNHQNREELVITNFVSDNQFKIDYVSKKWKSLCDEKTCYMIGFSDENLVISALNLNTNKTGFLQNSQEIKLGEKILDVTLFQNWNSSSESTEFIIVTASEKSQINWYKLDENYNLKHFWNWPIHKNISHINFFQLEYDNHLLIINQHLSQTTCDLYQFELTETPNFWLRQKLELVDFAETSSVVTSGPDYFIAIPQKSLNALSIYKLRENHFLSYKNLSSSGISDVIAFKTGHKSFLAINGLNAGIYRLTRKGLIKESLSNSHFSGVNFWLPIHLSVYGDDVMLIAQRSLYHGGHKSFVIEVITYNGDKFEEHEDIRCLYYGEEVLGLSCLPDEGSIEGSTLIYIDEVIGLVVPRRNRSSDLFLIKTEIKTISSPLDQQLDDFIKRKNEINNLIIDQEEKYKELVANPRQVFDFESMKAKLDEMDENISSMKAMAVPTHYDTVTFNNLVEIKSNLTAEEIQVEIIDNEPANSVLEDIVLKHNVSDISGPKIFKNLQVEDLVFEKVNGIDSNQLLFRSENVTIDGNLFFKKPLNVSEDIKSSRVNGRKFEEEVVNFGAPINDDLVFESVNVMDKAATQQINDNSVPTFFSETKAELETLSIPLNLQVKNVNGEDFDSFLKQLCLRNIRNYIPGTTKIKGDVTIEGDAKTEFLNNLKFPHLYVFSDNTFPNITGVKKFKNLVTSEIKSEGTINDIDISRLITLSTDQNISGITTFKNLKTTESINVDGDIIGEHASKFLPNPTLLHSDIVSARTHFKNLEVEGVIFLSENFNGKNFGYLLSDVVYISEEEPFIDGLKTFSEGLTVRKNLFISSNSINNINLDTIISKNTDQAVNLSVIDGIVTFGNVEIDGLYDSVDVKKLDEELVKLDGEQYISSTLIFEDELTVNELEAETVRQKDRSYEFLEAENVVVEGSVYGVIEGFDLEEFNKNRMSLTVDQLIESDLQIEQSFITNMSTGKINQIDSSEFSLESIKDKLSKRMFEGNLEVANLEVNSVEVDKIDNKSIIGLGGSLWRSDVKKYDLTNLSFNDNVHFGSLQIEKLGGVDFTTFVQNLVFKNETDVTIHHDKIFLKGLTVHKLIETQKINNISLRNILTKHGEQEITSPIIIQGNVQFDNNVTVENINNLPVNMITDFYQVRNDQVELKGDILFSRLPHIHSLQIQGYIANNSAQEFLDGIVYTDGNFKLRGQTIFKNNANIEKNIKVIGKTNNINLPAFVSDMVMITKDATIKSFVRFTKPTFIQHNMIVNNKLKTHNLNNIDLKSWMENAIFVDKGLLKGRYKFEDVKIVDHLQTDFINEIDVHTLVHLRSEQNLTELSFNEVSLFRDLPVGNSTNFHNLPNEFANTVLTNTDQEIDSEIEFSGHVFIEGNLDLSGLLNEMDLNRIVTTNTDQELNAIYDFKSKINVDQNMTVKGLINGINIAYWDLQGVKTSAHQIQNITDNWVIDQDLVFEEDAMGQGLINGLDFREFSHDIEEKRNYKYAIERAFIDDYTNICKDLTYMYGKLQNQIYKFNYLENFQMLNFESRIQYVYSYEEHNKINLLINEERNCESYLFTFDKKFRFVETLHLGLVAQIIPVRLNNLLYLVIRNQPFYSTCKVQGTNLWQVIDNHFVHVANIADQDLLQESHIPGIFYGLSGSEITEFRILPDFDNTVTKYRKWQVEEENIAFVPRGLATGFALRTGIKLIKLHREDPIIEDFSYDTEKIIRGNWTEEFNTYFPGRKNSDLVVMKVGIKSTKRSLLAVASHEETSVKGSLDFIKIYEDVLSGKMYHKVATYKPSSLISLEFNNGETLLVFMEDESVLQVYEYKGIEGFKHKLSSKIEGSELIKVEIPDGRKLIGVVDKNKISFIKAVMLGNQIEENLQCTL